MRVAELTRRQLVELMAVMQYADDHDERFRLAFDPADQTFKYKLAERTWSPPIRTQER